MSGPRQARRGTERRVGELRARVVKAAQENANAVADDLGVTVTILLERICLRDDLKELYLETVR